MKRRSVDQLELFDLSTSPARPRRMMPGVFRMELRHDQAMIGGIVVLIGLTVVFAFGVERGKQLARAERTFFPLRAMSGEGPGPSPTSGTVTDAGSGKTRQTEAKPRAPSHERAVPSGYAVQLVAYRQGQLARREMDRLAQAGEQAFIREREGFSVLYIGPFASKAAARQKVAKLKARYGDCFVRSL